MPENPKSYLFRQDGNYIDFIKEYKGIEIPEGTFIDKQGNKLGKNKGMASYTIGQRKGLGISFSEPKYVISKDSKANTVTLGTKEEAMVTGLIARDMNYILYDRPDREMNALAKTRYSQQEFPVRLIALDDDKARIVFDKPQPFAAPGQSVVLYEGDSVACGGIISETF